MNGEIIDSTGPQTTGNNLGTILENGQILNNFLKTISSNVTSSSNLLAVNKKISDDSIEQAPQGSLKSSTEVNYNASDNDNRIFGQLEKTRGVNIMADNSYITKQELDEKFNSLTEITDLKLKNISDKIDSSSRLIETKIETNSSKTDSKIEISNAKIDSKIEILNQSINDFKQSFPQTINLAVRDEFDKRDKERKETNRFIMGTIVIGIISIAVSTISIFVH
ncbi:MAG: hypothetical protein ABF975_01190 [Liquorilactobacillus hordei]|uniref:hypothetical protein n=1 Tax=Liquorilactobacillus hordei TaxID=468911 RepID=UPI0039ED780B